MKQNSYKVWTAEEEGHLRKVYSDTLTQRIADEMGRPIKSVQTKAHNLGLKKSHAFLSSEISGRVKDNERVKAHQFKAGHASHNKGKKLSDYMPPEALAAIQKTQFRKGITPPQQRPVGSERVQIDKCGKQYRYRKVADPNVWQTVQRIEWEAANGPIPDGCFLICRTHETLNTSPDNWHPVTRKEFMNYNTRHRFTPEVRQAISMLGGFRKTINHHIKKQQENEKH